MKDIAGEIQLPKNFNYSASYKSKTKALKKALHILQLVGAAKKILTTG
jgi:hypothetical protein